MIRRPPRSTLSSSSAASDVYKRQVARQSHFMLQGKGITDMAGLQSVPARACTSLYLYDNSILCIDGLNNLHGLRDLYLQNNGLTELANLQHCRGLQRLFAENNQISAISGLDQCESLFELHLAGQRLEEGQTFQFEEASMTALNRSLAVLDLSACNVVDPSPLSMLYGLQTLNLEKNQIEDLNSLGEMLPDLQRLQKLTLLGNPVCSMGRMRQHVLIWGQSLTELDDKEVLHSERSYLAHVQKRMDSQERSPSGFNAPAGGTGIGLDVVPEVGFDELSTPQ
eukprot:TRINITY_DN12456_c0_g1_i3.p1 TRINITY_DN12456_c0_g1~~TRINITY_DN12456_c0_g1_i3.p1  ORF type:complete len:282 (+),score=70.87 TRINITY_DN12456_c0_g1_i3:102-947(+)